MVEKILAYAIKLGGDLKVAPRLCGKKVTEKICKKQERVIGVRTKLFQPWLGRGFKVVRDGRFDATAEPLQEHAHQK